MARRCCDGPSIHLASYTFRWGTGDWGSKAISQLEIRPYVHTRHFPSYGLLLTPTLSLFTLNLAAVTRLTPRRPYPLHPHSYT